MSMNDTDKWASQIINELFDEDMPFDKNFIDVKVNVNEDKNGNAEITVLENESIANEFDSSENFISTSTIEFVEKSDDLVLGYDKSVSVNDGIFERLPVECNVLELLSASQSKSTYSNEWDISSSLSCLTSDDNEKVEVIKDALNNILSDIENSKDERDIESNILETDNTKFIKSETINSNSFKGNFCEISSNIATTATLDFKAFNKDMRILKSPDGKAKLLEFIGYGEQSNLNNYIKRPHSLTDVYIKYFARNLNKEQMKWGGSYPLLRYKEKSAKTELFNILQNFDVKEKNLSLEDDYKFQINGIVSDVNANDGDLFNQRSIENKDEKSANIIVSFKRKYRNPVNQFHRSLDDIQNSSKICCSPKHVRTEMFRNSTPKRIGESSSICPILDSTTEGTICPIFDFTTEITKCGNRSMVCFRSNNNTSSSEDVQRDKKNGGRRDDIEDEENGNPDNDDVLLLQTDFKIVTFYRNICSSIEGVLVRPSAILIAELIDFLFFIFIVIVYLIYITCENVSATICRFFKNDLMKLDGISGRETDHVLMPFGELPNLLTDSQELTEKIETAKTEESTKIGKAAKIGECVVTAESTKIEKFAKTKELSLVSKESISLSNHFNIANLHLRVHPKDVLILNSMFEQINHDFDYKYEKGEYFKFLEKKRTDVVKIYDHSFVDILLEACEECTGDKDDENDFDMEIIASSIKSEFKLHESEKFGPYNKSKFSQTSQKISAGRVKSTELKILHSADSNDSDLKIFPYKDERYMLNSTEVDDSQFETRATFRNSFNSSDGYIPETSKYCVSPTSIEKITSACSMSVNLPSFASRSNMFLDDNSLSLSDKMGDISDVKESIASEELRLKMVNSGKENSFVNLNLCWPEDLENKARGDSSKSPLADEVKMSPKNVNIQTYSDTSSSSTNIALHRNSSGILHETSFMGESSELKSKLSDVNTEIESLIQTETISTSDQKVPKNKTRRGLRRRMSVILSNWKNMQVMPCANPKKKYKKQSKYE